MAKEKNSKGKYSHNRQSKIFRNWGLNTWEEIKERLDEKQKPAQGSNDKKKL
tara:strand:+ start:108 stop:263 length:156 start_codon:yes stop_codon:yes gene_type:complete